MQRVDQLDLLSKLQLKVLNDMETTRAAFLTLMNQSRENVNGVKLQKQQATMDQKKEAKEQQRRVYMPEVSSILSRQSGRAGRCIPNDVEDAYKEVGTSELVVGVVRTPEEGRRRKRYLFDGQTGWSFRRYWQGGFKALEVAQNWSEGKKLRDRAQFVDGNGVTQGLRVSENSGNQCL